jgi:hypothetical protein
VCTQKNTAFFESVEIPVSNAGSTKIYFPDQPQLRIQPGQRIYITDMEIFTDLVAAKTPLLQNNTAPSAEITKAVLALYIVNEERIHWVPLWKLNRINDGTNPFQQQWESLADLEVDFSKSYVQLSSAPANFPYAFYFGVQYKRSLQNF